MRRHQLVAVATLALILILFVLARLPLLVTPGVLLGWDSDAAIFGLMAKKICEGRGFDFFFWGVNYLGPLTSTVAAGVGLLRKLVDLEPTVGPLQLRVATCITVGTGIVFFWLALRSAGAAVAGLTALFLAIGPPLLFWASVHAVGPDMVFLLGAIMTLFGSRSPPGDSRLWWGTFGLLMGLSTWMNQGALFFAPGVLFVALPSSSLGRALPIRSISVREGALRIRDHLFLRAYRLQDRERRLLAGLQMLLAAQLGYVVVRDVAGWRTPLPGFYWPLLEPLALLMGIHALLIVWRGDGVKVPWQDLMRLIWPAAGGFLIAYSPVLLGRLFDWYPRGYSFAIRVNYPSEVAAGLAGVFHAALPTLYSPVGVAGWVVVAWLLIYLVRRRVRAGPALTILCVAALGILVFFVMTERAPFRTHYLMPAVPGAWALMALGIAQLWREHRSAAAVVAAAVLLMGLAMGSGRLLFGYLGDRDPRPVISGLEAERCAVVYAEFWTAYKYRFLTQERFMFISHESQDRSPKDTAVYQQAPGRRCLLRSDGTVIPAPHRGN